MEIKELRKELKMTQKEFAERFNIPLRTIQKWEQHDSEPASYLIELIKVEVMIDKYADVSRFIRKPQTRFRITNKRPFLNNEMIHPIHQNDVEKLIEEIKQYVEVQKIVIFGSSTEERCNYDSDIDIYVELSKDVNVKKLNIETPVDFWTNFTIEPQMLDEINKKGVTVYAR